MKPAPILTALAAMALLAPGAFAGIPSAPPSMAVSAFALPMGDPGARAGDLLAQRTIDREWGPSDDSLYKVIDVPGWKSEGLALGMSAVLPGSGHLYAGENSGWLYLLAESAGLMGRWMERRTATRRYDDLVRFTGDPTDSTAGFSFQRYTRQTGATADQLMTLWAGDRNAYYRAIADDPGYASGFAGLSAANEYEHFSTLLASHDEALHRATLIETLLLAEHVVAALDAFRATRLRNLPLRQQYHLELGEKWRHGGPELRAAVVRRF